MQPNSLEDIDADEVSPVRRGAVGKRFAFAKSATELDPELLDALTVPHEREGALLDELRKADIDESGQRGALAIVRLLKGFDEVPLELIEKAMASQADQPSDETDPDDDWDYTDCVAKGTDKPYGDVAYADPGYQADGKSRYPVDTEEHIRAAWSYISKPKNAAKYSDGDLSKVKDKIRAAMKQVGADVEKDAGDELGATTTEEQQMSENAAPAVPILKADGSWDLSGVPEESRGFYESVLKAADTAKAENEVLKERVEKAEASAETATAALREREFVAKADSEFGKIAPATELGAVLKEAHEKLDAETVEKLEEILKGANAKVEQGDLFADLGAKVLKGHDLKSAAGVSDATSGDGWAKIEALAKGLVEKSDGDLSQEQAIARVLKTADGQAAYAEYMADYYGGVA